MVPLTFTDVSFSRLCCGNLAVARPRSGAIFSTWTSTFDIAPLVPRAVAAESDDQEDCKPQDLLNEINEEWPLNPLNDVDEEWPPPDPLNQVDDLPPPPLRKHRASVHFDDIVADGPPLSGPHRLKAPHRRRAAK
ncbi:hypothetical protein B0H14DRAFT_3459446 [Mycena olivaceomarginata]|nr:hypothetical protein B0H14DRAFT_3459446 [Mycena olivaceomarginata]